MVKPALQTSKPETEETSRTSVGYGCVPEWHIHQPIVSDSDVRGVTDIWYLWLVHFWNISSPLQGLRFDCNLSFIQFILTIKDTDHYTCLHLITPALLQHPFYCPELKKYRSTPNWAARVFNQIQEMWSHHSHFSFITLAPNMFQNRF